MFWRGFGGILDKLRLFEGKKTELLAMQVD